MKNSKTRRKVKRLSISNSLNRQIVIGFLALLLIVSGVWVYASYAGWSDEAVQVSFTLGDSEHVSVSADSRNMSFFVWHDNSTGTDLIYIAKGRFNGSTGNFTMLDNGTNITGHKSMYPKIAIDVEDNIHVVYQDFRFLQWEVYYLKLSRDYEIQREERITATLGQSKNPDIALDGSCNAHLVWQDNNGTGHYELYYTKIVDTKPDFTVSAWIEEALTIDDWEYVNFSANNIGDLGADNVRLVTFLNDREQVASYSDLENGSSRYHKFNIFNVSEQAYEFRFEIDSYDKVIEQDEHNNVLRRVFNVQDASMWPNFMHNVKHDGISSRSVPPQSDIAWMNYTVGDIYAPIVAHYGYVYVVSFDGESNVSVVYAFNESTGAQVWNGTYAEKIVSAPALYAGNMYLASLLINDTGNYSKVYSLNASSGRRDWVTVVTEGGEPVLYSSPLVANNRIYLGGNNGTAFSLLMNGSLDWQADIGTTYSTPAVYDTKVYFTANPSNGTHTNATLYCLDYETGEINWTYAADAGTETWTSPSLEYGLNDVSAIYFGWNLVGGATSNLVKVDAHGGQAWETSFTHPMSASPVFDGERVFALTDAAQLRCRYSNGSACLELFTDKVDNASATIALGEELLVMSCFNKTYVINKTGGDDFWSYETTTEGHGDVPAPSPALAYGKLFVAGENVIYAFYKNLAPVVQEIANVTVNETGKVTITVDAEDPNADALTYAIDSDLFIHSTSTPSVFTWQTQYGDAGIYNITINVSDGSLTQMEQFAVIVEELNRSANVSMVYPNDGEVIAGDTSAFVSTSGDIEIVESANFTFFNATHNFTMRVMEETVHSGFRSARLNSSAIPKGEWKLRVDAYDNEGNLLSSDETDDFFTVGYSINLPQKRLGHLVTDENGDEIDALENLSRVQMRKDGTRKVEFNLTGDADITGMVVNSTDTKTVVDFGSATGTSSVHALYVPVGSSTYVYVCPDALSIENVNPSCSNYTEFSYDECSVPTWRNSILCEIDGSDYKLSNLTGTGASQGDSAAFNFTLYRGMNLISFPIIPDNLSFSAVIHQSNSSYNITQVFRRNNSDGVYTTIDYYHNQSPPEGTWYDPTTSPAEPVFDLDNTYWFKTSQGFTWTLEGDNPSGNRTVDIVSGMNLVGWASMSQTNFSTAIRQSAASYNITQVYRRDNTDGRYSVMDYYPAHNQPAGLWYDPVLYPAEPYFVPGAGYWLYAEAAFNWTYPAD